MKAEKREQLIREAVRAGRQDAEAQRDNRFFTVDVVTGLGDGPAMVSFPFPFHVMWRDGRCRIDLAEIGYRLTPL